MTETPTDKKLSERFGGFDSAERQERAVFMDAFDGADSKLFAKRVAAGIAALDKLRALRLAESHPSAIREAVEGEREACAKIAERFAEQNRQQAIESKRRANKLNGLGGEMAETLAESAEIASMECDAAFHEADAIAAAIRARGEENGQ